MIDLLLWIFVFFTSIYVLIKSADYFTDSAEEVGLFFGLSPFLVGMTIVAFGSSLPELVSSLVAVYAGVPQIVPSLVIGSNITNLFLVFGVAILFSKKMKIDFDISTINIPFFMASTFYLGLTLIDGLFTFSESLFGIALLVLYTTYVVKDHDKSFHYMKPKLEQKSIFILVISCVFVYLGAKFAIDSVIMLSNILFVPTEFFALSILALGMSLPELIITIRSNKKNKPQIAIGNILGANIYNSLAVIGIPGLFANLIVPSSVLIFALPMMIVGTFIYFFIVRHNQLTVWEGMLLIIFYLFFIVGLF